jgi:tetratricopeptide (TPR) repeat protein
MYRIIFCTAAALLTLSAATGSAAADDREVCHTPLGGGEAIAACSRLIERNPKDADAYRHRGGAYSVKGIIDRGDQARADYTQAIADYSRAIDLDPKSADAYAARAAVFGKTFNLVRAIADYGQVIKLNPKNPNAYIDRGVSYSLQNDYDRAIADLDQAIRLDPQGTATDSPRPN